MFGNLFKIYDMVILRHVDVLMFVLLRT